MYKDVRPAATGAVTASTPEAWAENFAGSKRIGGWRLRRYGASKEAKLIRRYIPAGGSVVDAGSGSGEWVAWLTSAGYRATGVDFSPELIRRSREAYPDAEWLQGDIRRMPLDEGSVDGVISWGVIEHDEAGPGAALRDFLRILKPGGHAVITVPLDTPVARRALEMIHRQPESDHAFFQYLMSLDELRRECLAAGFEIAESGHLPSAHLAHVAPKLYGKLPPLLDRLAGIAMRPLFSWTTRYDVMIYAVVRKPLR